MTGQLHQAPGPWRLVVVLPGSSTGRARCWCLVLALASLVLLLCVIRVQLARPPSQPLPAASKTARAAPPAALTYRSLEPAARRASSSPAAPLPAARKPPAEQPMYSNSSASRWVPIQRPLPAETQQLVRRAPHANPAAQASSEAPFGARLAPVRHAWRRPRLQEAEQQPQQQQQQQSKTYSRVLLCDKTLVSLDYVRHLAAEPRPDYGGSNNNLDNSIEIDGFIDDPNYTLDRRLGAPANPAGQPDAPNSTLSGPQPEPRADAEDALVKCDMWDLEKGLKSRKPPGAVLRRAVKADFETVREAINRCRQLSESTLPADDEYRDGIEVMSSEDLASLFSMKRGLIPGTKWCGLGDQASSYNDLGPKHRIDICCRAHDHCPIRLKPFRNDYGVLNIALYTKSHCDCDADFYRCLREVRSRTADMLGNLYFNVMKLQCMREQRMKVCREMRYYPLGFERCVRYEESPVKTVFKFTTPPVAY